VEGTKPGKGGGDNWESREKGRERAKTQKNQL